jgi:hypothetical protein
MGGILNPQQLATSKKLRADVVIKVKRRKTKSSIVSDLVDSGMDPLRAKKMVEDVLRELYEKAEGERMDWGALGVSIPAGLLASIIGGAIWGVIVLLGSYSAGFMTLGVGLLTGLAVVFFSGQRGWLSQIVSGLLCLVGIAIGHYASFYALVKAAVTEAYGPTIAEQSRWLNLGFLRFFIDSLPDLFDRYDFIWLGLGVVVALIVPLKPRWRSIRE